MQLCTVLAHLGEPTGSLGSPQTQFSSTISVMFGPRIVIFEFNNDYLIDRRMHRPIDVWTASYVSE